MNRFRLLSFALLLAFAGCLTAPGMKEAAPPATLWSAAAEKVEAGEWSMTQKLVKDLGHVAKASKVPFPADYDSFFATIIKTNRPLTDDDKKQIAEKLRAWGSEAK